MIRCATLAAVLCLFGLSTAQRITTIQLDGVQYFVSRMNPYSPELNFFLAYQYCRSLGLQLVSFETKEKADSISAYLSNAGFGKYDFWTSGNRLGTDMYLWMSTGLPFNATFNYMKGDNIEAEAEGLVSPNVPTGSTSPQRTARDSGDSGSSSGCVTLKAPRYEWVVENCMNVKDFICEQTRCYYYNYGSIPVSSAQGRNRAAALRRTTATPASTTLLSQTRSASKTASTLAASLSPVTISTTTTTTKINPINTKAVPKTPNVLPVVTESVHPNYFSQLIMNNIRNNSTENSSPENILKVDIHPVFLHSSTTTRLNNKEIDLEQSTNGPYENYNTNVEMQDEPAVEDEGYISTIPPEKETGFNENKST